MAQSLRLWRLRSEVRLLLILTRFRRVSSGAAGHRCVRSPGQGVSSVKIRSLVTRGVAALSAFALSMSATSAFAQTCVNDKTIQAMQIRIAQTELMVAGLSCKQYEQYAEVANIKRYNAFVTRYQPVLMDDGHRVLKRFFPTEQRLNDYLTRLANEAQLRGNANMAIFCTQAAKIYDDLLNHGTVQLGSYSASLPMAGKHGHTPCNVQPVAAAPIATPAAQDAPAVQAVPVAEQPAVLPPVRSPVVRDDPPAPGANAAPKMQTIASVIAANGASTDGSAMASMQPVPDISMRPAVKNPPRPMLKPEGI